MFTINVHDEDRREYVPDIGDNVRLAEEWDGVGEEPYFWVDLLPMSQEDLQRVQTISARKLRKKKRRDIDFIAGGAALVRHCIARYVPAVHNLTLVTRSGKAVPATGEELYDALQTSDPSLGAIIDDIDEALKDWSKASEGDLKKLRARSDSSALEVPIEDLEPIGNALDAATTTTQPITMISEKAATATEK